MCIPLHPNPSAPCVATPGAAAAGDAAYLLQLVLHGAGPLHHVAATVIVYIQQARGWVIGFSVPVVLMVTALTLFLLGSPFYLKAAADRSAILGLVQVLVASYKNRHEPMPPETADALSFHNKAGAKPRTPTNKLKIRYLNRACVLRNPGKELSADGVACDPWRLCTVQQVEPWRTSRPSSACCFCVATPGAAPYGWDLGGKRAWARFLSIPGSAQPHRQEELHLACASPSTARSAGYAYRSARSAPLSMCRDLTFNLRDDVCFRFVLNGDHFLLLKAVTPDCIYVLLQRPIGATKPIEQGARSGHYFFY
ncbi:hypothetical protein PVAP13_6KG214512 [Panicum virgatum]|uniref:Uncharacterized protein n=1 Tax=Panicum virgatum TaxID=38727 RepID=A0A8T0RE77_PANVG|nr:hypothetical protein PVAP13_6KG214512 [Panicum virgatum]